MSIVNLLIPYSTTKLAIKLVTPINKKMTTKIDPIIDEKYCSDVVQNAIKVNQKLEGSLLPILHNIQAKLRCVPESAVKPIAKALNLSRAEVHGVITYYHTFTSTGINIVITKSCANHFLD